MADAKTTLEFNPEQAQSISKLSGLMVVVAGVLLALGALRLVLGIWTLLFVSGGGFFTIIEGALTAFLGLILLTTATDARYMVQTKYTPIHLGHLFNNLAMFYKVLFYLALLMTLVVGIGLL